MVRRLAWSGGRVRGAGPGCVRGAAVSRALREIGVAFVAAAPAGARVRTRLRVSAGDAVVLTAVGRHLGSLAGRDLAARCAEGRLDARGRAASRAVRKRALTAESSSRWAGAITRASEDAYQLGCRNLAAEQRTLQARVRAITARLAVPAGERHGRLAGYATPAERHAKTIRRKALQARLARVEQRIEAGAVPVTRGGRKLMRARLNLAAAGLTQAQWRDRWDAARLFLTADGERDAPWGNYTIAWNPDEGWLEVNLPAPLAHLANRPHGRYRLSCEVRFGYRGDEVAAQAATGAVRYDICSTRPVAAGTWTRRGRPRRARPCRAGTDGGSRGRGGRERRAPRRRRARPGREPHRDPVHHPARPGRPARDGPRRAGPRRSVPAHRYRHAGRGAGHRHRGPRLRPRPRAGPRSIGPAARGRRGRGFRRLVAGIPTARFRDRLVQMTANAGLSVVVVDPAYTSRWGAEHWLAPLRQHHPETTGHNAAALVIGRRGQGHRAGRRANGNRAAPEDAARPARARPRKHPPAAAAPRKPAAHGTPGSHLAVRPECLTGPRQATRRPKTARGHPPSR